MTEKQENEIVKISKEFTAGIGIPIEGSGWFVADPLSGFLNSIGYENKLGQLPASEMHPQILILTFSDGSQLIPAGSDLKNIHKDAENWMWING